MNESNIKQNQQNNGRANDEIDLLEISSNVWKGIKSLVKGITSFIVAFTIFTIRKSVWVGSFALIGVLLGFIYSNIIKKSYYTSMLEGFSGGVENSIVIDHINQLDRLVKNSELLASHLNMSVEQAEQVYSIKAFYGIDINFDGKWDYIDEINKSNPRSLRDTLMIRVPSVFFIRVQLYDEDILPVLRDRLFKYINSNSYIQALFDVDKRHKMDMIAEIDKEIGRIDRLDTLQHLLRSGRDKGIEMSERLYLFGGSEPELKLFYDDILMLHRQKQYLERSLEISKEPVVIVQDFIAAQWEEKTKRYYALTVGFILVIIGYFVAICWTFREKLWKIIMKDPIKYFE